MRLDPSAALAGVGLLTHDRIGSTNAEALRLARAGQRGPMWIVARSQTEGRGRRGRAWVSEPGNLYATLLLSDPGPPERLSELSFVAALALHDALAAPVAGLGARLSLKWPNDVLIDGNKVAGILVEAEGRAVAVGIGVNCAHHPDRTAYPATDLATAGVRRAPEEVLVTLSAAMVRRLQQWQRGADFASVRADWLARATRLGKRVRVSLPDGEREGIFESIDDRGCMLLRSPDGRLDTVLAGEVASPADRIAAQVES